MPINPLQLRPGRPLQDRGAAARRRTAFALANGFIDLEPILLFCLTGEPVHRFFHVARRLSGRAQLECAKGCQAQR
ncbi:MAG: hypothetical protein M5R42_18350 [Rhodocyclaceae bacterium]|nr:hypothetical protein [Rhodocyclaceae bacterium]